MIDLITGHQGVAHISADQIASINNAMMDNYGANKVMRLVGGELTANGLTIEVGTGYWRANGFDMEVQEAETIYIDPTAAGLSRIDNIYVEILQDIPTGAQRSEIVTVNGEPSATPTAPEAPTAPELNTDILLQVVPLASVTVTEGAMVMTDLSVAYEMVTPSEISDIVNVYGAKNLLDSKARYKTGENFASFYTMNNDGTITVNVTSSTSTGSARITPKDNDSSFVLPAGTYILSGEGSTNNFYILIRKNEGNTELGNTKNGATFEFTANGSDYFTVLIRKNTSATVSTAFVIKPMIRCASIQDDTYEPYAETNQQLTTRKVSWDDFSEIGSVNILENDATTQTTSGITFTRNTNGSITCSGTATANITYDIKTQPKMEDGKQYLLKSFQPGSSANAYLSYSDIQHSDYGDFDGNGVIITKFNYSTAPYSKVRLRILSGTSFETPMTFYPLLTPILDYSGPYVPYAKTNRELTDAFTNQVANSDDTYSPSKAYKVGEHCIYNNVIYKCITACSAGSWSTNQSCFSQTTLTSAVTDLNSSLTNYVKAVRLEINNVTLTKESLVTIDFSTQVANSTPSGYKYLALTYAGSVPTDNYSNYYVELTALNINNKTVNLLATYTNHTVKVYVIAFYIRII